MNGAWLRSAWERFLSLPPLWLAVAAAVVVAVASYAGWQAYRTYDYVQHDNRFCLSCHLMREPYERVAESAHRDLGCKECHQPTQVERTMMALRQVVVQPDEITHHADVPNARCASCHIDGDPEQWKQIAATEGHRVHFESDAPELAGLMCVECHSTSIHDFVPATRTCAQAGCHPSEADIVLGGMAAADAELHCMACHNFLREPRFEVAVDTVLRPLTPRERECNSCHQMAEVMATMELAADPHGAVCGACHNPHTQAAPRDAVGTCLDCHAQPDTLTPFHRGLPVGVLDGCLACHDAHRWTVDGANCLACHPDVMTPPPGVRRIGQAGGRPDAAVAARVPLSELRGAGRPLPAGHPSRGALP